MQKVVDFLEKHVQWVALGIGALYLLYMVWSYVLTPPVTKEVAGTTLTPGTVDQFILENRIHELDAKVKGTRTVDIAVPDFSEQFKVGLDGGQAPVWDGLIVDSKPADSKFKDSTANDAQDGLPAGERIAALPIAPAPKVTEAGTGRSLVIEPQQRGPRQNDPKARRAPDRRGGARAVADKPAGIDKDWVTVFVEIPTEEIVEEFKKVNLPDDFYLTSVISMELVRERQLPDGTWGEETVVAPPEFLNAMPFPGENKAQQLLYDDWAVKNSVVIIQPNFYQIAKGALWPPVEMIDDVIDPAEKAKRDAEMKRRAEERKRKQEQQRRMQQQRRPANNRNRAPAGMPGGGMGMPGGGMFAPRDNARPARAQQQQPPMMPGMDPMMIPGMMPGMMPGDLPGMDRMPGAQPGRNANPKFNPPPLPPAIFDPREEDVITGWLHDVTVEPGNVYRYKVKYRLKNPVFDQPRVVTDPALAQVYALESKTSDWSDEVEVPPMSYLFIAGGIMPNSTTVRFDIFKWNEGEWKLHTIEAAPGDLITGEVKDDETGEPIDFTTDTTVVALHRNPLRDDVQILLVDKAGVMELRDYASDRDNPTYRELKQEVADAAATDTRPRAAAR